MGVLTKLEMNCEEETLEKKLALPCLFVRVAGIEAYQKALRDGLDVSDAVKAGYSRGEQSHWVQFRIGP